MVEVKINEDIKIGGNNPCFIIAEVGQNHQGDIEIAKKLIKAAKDAGANCVKFQKTCLKEKFTKKYLERPYENPNSWGKTYGDHKTHLEFTESQFRELLKYAKEVGIPLAASAMDMVSFDFLVNNKAPFIKIGSGDSNNPLFLKYAASKNVPLIISTGMVDKKAVKSIYDILSKHHKQFCLLHCVSAYPVPYEDCNLNVLQDYKQSFDVPIGYSGHEVGTPVALAAVALGAKIAGFDCQIKILLSDSLRYFGINCGGSYSGQTKRTIACRMKEHIKAVRNNDTQKSAIAEHLIDSGSNHWIELHNPQIISTERKYIPRLVKEAIEITKHKNFNREDGLKFQLSGIQ
ncbi:hypothetical protein evm_014663 [Chilo suppressalis]|nr:hypothetical protein evm_014663 [Chilo suppressalis]